LCLLDGIVSYMAKQAGPASKELKTVEDWKKYLEKPDPVIIGKLLCWQLVVFKQQFFCEFEEFQNIWKLQFHVNTLSSGRLWGFSRQNNWMARGFAHA